MLVLYTWSKTHQSVSSSCVGQACNPMNLLEPWDQACSSVYLREPWGQACKCVKVNRAWTIAGCGSSDIYSSVSETGADGIITAFASSSDLLARGGRVLQGGPQHHYHLDHMVDRRAVHNTLIGTLSR